MRLSFLMGVVIWLCLSATHALAQEENLDGFCKSDVMPGDKVAVGEMDSIQCKTAPPGRSNAWLIDKVHTGVVACAPPNYADGYPPAIGYVVCDHVESTACPMNLDGTPNGFKLTLPNECRSAIVRSQCIWWEGNSGRSGNISLGDADPIFLKTSAPSYTYNFNHRLHGFVLGIALNDPDCAINYFSKKHDDKVWWVEDLAPGEPLPVCLDLNRGLIEGERAAIGDYNEDPFSRKVIVIRRFRSANCGPYIVDKKEQTFNAIVVRQLESFEWQNDDYFACSETVLKKYKGPPWIFIPGTGGMRIVETAAELYKENGAFKIKSIVHDDRCGGGLAKNAYQIRFLPQSER